MTIIHREEVGAFIDPVRFDVHTHDVSTDCISIAAQIGGVSVRFCVTPAQARDLGRALIRGAFAANPERPV